MEWAHVLGRLLVLVSVGSFTSGQFMSYDSDAMDTMQDMAEDRRTYMMYQRLYGGTGAKYNTRSSYATQQRPTYQNNYQSYGGNTKAYGGNTNAYGGNTNAYRGNTNAYGGNINAYGGNTNAYGGNTNAYGGNAYRQNTQQRPWNYQQNGGHNMNNQNRGPYQRPQNSQSLNTNNGANSQPSKSPVPAQDNFLQKTQGGSFQQGLVNAQGHQQQASTIRTNRQPSFQSYNNNNNNQQSQHRQQIQTKCSQVTLDRSSGRPAVNFPGAVSSITLMQQTRWSQCTPASYGFIGRYAYVGNRCSGQFNVCYQ
ncbi:GATA zinc finger domain-containing protein 14-like [Haliotis rufescens]|uniref:GATA zinc finger domain-containing protein 14-like n=1 Tax=Haliotis rufescens TaxID=6454 RepID=UPI001EB09B8A|nr:GATA zinc finger domain-containing protein 14-like [Haliotis rufescens]